MQTARAEFFSVWLGVGGFFLQSLSDFRPNNISIIYRQVCQVPAKYYCINFDIFRAKYIPSFAFFWLILGLFNVVLLCVSIYRYF